VPVLSILGGAIDLCLKKNLFKLVVVGGVESVEKIAEIANFLELISIFGLWIIWGKTPTLSTR
jgi:hypothetical protein